MNLSRKARIVLLGSMSRFPVPGVIWQTLHYLVGLQRLGYDVYYVEAHDCTPRYFIRHTEEDRWSKAALFIDKVMERFNLGGRWALHAPSDGCYYGFSADRLRKLYRSAGLLINLHGATVPLPEQAATGRLIYLETDPVDTQIGISHNIRRTLALLAPHCAFFTFAENYGKPDCRLPVSRRFLFRPTRQPIVLDFWQAGVDKVRRAFTTVASWLQPYRPVNFRGEVYHWSKHYEFLKFLDLPRHTNQIFELSLSNCSESDRQLLESKAWRVKDAFRFSTDIDAYRSYILRSRGEFTVAKDQNVRLRTGWFSDRSATYLAAGRPVITQETGFSNVLPTGRGLFAFSTMEEIATSVESINSDYVYHRRAAAQLAREFFSHDVVLPHLLKDLGV